MRDGSTGNRADLEFQRREVAEREHQKYLAVNPHGYRCHAKTGMALPELDTQ